VNICLGRVKVFFFALSVLFEGGTNPFRTASRWVSKTNFIFIPPEGTGSNQNNASQRNKDEFEMGTPSLIQQGNSTKMKRGGRLFPAVACGSIN